MPVLDPPRLVHSRLFLQGEGQRLGLVQDLEPADLDLHFSRGQLRVLRAGRAALDGALDGQHELGADFLGRGMGLTAGRGVEDALGQPLPVAQVHEDQPAVVSPPEGPPHERHGLADVSGPEFSAHMGPAPSAERRRHRNSEGGSPPPPPPPPPRCAPANPPPPRRRGPRGGGGGPGAGRARRSAPRPPRRSGPPAPPSAARRSCARSSRSRAPAAASSHTASSAPPGTGGRGRSARRTPCRGRPGSTGPYRGPPGSRASYSRGRAGGSALSAPCTPRTDAQRSGAWRGPASPGTPAGTRGHRWSSGTA